MVQRLQVILVNDKSLPDGCLEDVAAGYTIHADPSVQHAAADVLRRSMRALPKLRNALLLGMAAFASRLPEDFPEALNPCSFSWQHSAVSCF
jgi:hypothetical protein